MKTVFILAGVEYESMRQRPHHMAVFLAKKGYRVIFIGITDIYKLSSRVISLKKSNQAYFENIFKMSEEGIYFFDKKNVSSFTELTIEDLNKVLGWITSLFLSDDPVLIVGFPMWTIYMEEINRNITIIYDCMDDWESFKEDLDLGYQDDMIYYERKLAHISDLVIVSSNCLYAKMALVSKNVLYIPNGVWNKDYVPKEKSIPDDIMSIDEPIIFFMGAIAEWVDIELIDYLSSKRPQYSFVFVGMCLDVKLPKKGNIFYLGEKKYDVLSNYLSRATVAIIPFKVNKLTAAVTPLKFYEYLSSGTPVVATIMPDILGLGGSKIALTYEEFLKYIDEYVEMSSEEYEMERQKAFETGKTFDWENLLEPLNSILRNEKEKYPIISKENFINNVICSYQIYNDNPVIKEQLLTFYNLMGKYDLSCSLYDDKDVAAGVVNTDYCQLALAYFKTGRIREVRQLLHYRLKDSRQSVFAESLLSQKDDVLLEIYLHKLTGDVYTALEKADHVLEQYKSDPRFLGLMSGLYLDIAEFDASFHLAIEAVQANSSRLGLEQILDFYSLKNFIIYLSEQKNFDLAEEICLYLMGINDQWEKEFMKLLSDVYISKNLAN